MCNYGNLITMYNYNAGNDNKIEFSGNSRYPVCKNRKRYKNDKHGSYWWLIHCVESVFVVWF